jgi:hypothetical protein
MRSRFTHNISLGACLCFFSVGRGLASWMQRSCIEEFLIGFKSIQEFYPSSPLGVDNADTRQLPKEKNTSK